jgi:hypothetical protein
MGIRSRTPRVAPDVVGHLKMCLLDSLGCGLFGASQSAAFRREGRAALAQALARCAPLPLSDEFAKSSPCIQSRRDGRVAPPRSTDGWK